MWLQGDSGASTFSSQVGQYTHADGSLNWGEALDFCENLAYAGRMDWRLPDAKELHSIVDYTRSPDYTGSAAIDPLFISATFINERNEIDFPGFWASTSFEPGADGVVIYFGEALGYLFGQYLDVHGAGAQRTDLKQGTPSAGNGPQGDVRRVYNYARCVCNNSSESGGSATVTLSSIYLLLLND